MQPLMQDLRYALRSLAKNPGFTAVAVLTLALGIGANTAIFSVVDAVLLRQLPYPAANRLVSIQERNPKAGVNISVSAPTFVELEARTQSLEDIGAYTFGTFNVTGSAEPERLSAALITPSLLTTIGVEPLLGRVFTTEEGQPGRDNTVVLSYALWQTRFGGDTQVLGKTLTLDGQPLVVVGVMPAGFSFPTPGLALWATIPIDLNRQEQGPNEHFLAVVGRLKPNVQLAAARAEGELLARQIAAINPVAIGERTFDLAPLRERVVGRARTPLLVVLGAVAFVLLIACGNMANLLLARAAGREREIAVRTALGAARGRLIRQLLTESVLLAVLGGVAGLFVAQALMSAIVSLAPANIPRLSEVGLNGTILVFAIVVSVATGILFGLAPALHAAKSDLASAFRGAGGAAGGRERARVRSALIVAEVALSVVLLIGAGLMLRSFSRLTAVDPGFNPDHVLTMQFNLPSTVYRTRSELDAARQRVRQAVASVPGVRAAGGISHLPLSGADWMILATLEGGADPIVANNRLIAPGYFRTMEILIKRGRDVTDDDRAGAPPVVLINEAMARRFWPGQDAIGRRMKWGPPQSPRPWLTVVGIVPDVRHAGLDAEPVPETYMPYSQLPEEAALFFRTMSLTIRTVDEPLAMAGAVRAAIRAVAAEVPVTGVASMDDQRASSVSPRRFKLLLLGSFAALALALSAVGIYGVVMYGVTQRTREIGVRVALGAQADQVLGLILREGMRLAVIGLAIGVAGAVALTRVLRTQLYEVSPTDPTTFAGIVIILATVAAIASWLPARRASRVDPMVALRNE